MALSTPRSFVCLDYSAWVACPSNVQRALLLSQSQTGTLTLLDADNNIQRELTGWSGWRPPFLSHLGGDGLLHLIKVVDLKPRLYGEGQMLPIKWFTFDPDACRLVSCETKLVWPLPIDQVYHAQSCQALGVDLCETEGSCRAWLVVLDAITLQEKSRMALYTHAPSATATFGGAFWNHDGSMVAALMYHELAAGHSPGQRPPQWLGRVHIFDTATGSRLLSLQLRLHLEEVTVCWSPGSSLVAVHQFWSRPPRAGQPGAGTSPAKLCDLERLFGPEHHGLVIGATGSAIENEGFGISPGDRDGLRILDPAAQQVYVIPCRIFLPVQTDESQAQGSPGPYMSFKTCAWSPCGNLLLAGWRLSSGRRSTGFSIYASQSFGSVPENDQSASVLDSLGCLDNMTWRTVPGADSRVAAFFPLMCLYVLFEKVGRHWHAHTTDLHDVIAPGRSSFLDPCCRSLLIHASDGHLTHLELASQTFHCMLSQHQQQHRYAPHPQWTFPAAWSPVYAYLHAVPPQAARFTGPTGGHWRVPAAVVVLTDAA